MKFEKLKKKSSYKEMFFVLYVFTYISSPILISSHIAKQSEKIIELFNLEFDNDYSLDTRGKPCILISFTELKYKG
jgi:hypothetical protein